MSAAPHVLIKTQPSAPRNKLTAGAGRRSRAQNETMTPCLEPSRAEASLPPGGTVTADRPRDTRRVCSPQGYRDRELSSIWLRYATKERFKSTQRSLGESTVFGQFAVLLLSLKSPA